MEGITPENIVSLALKAISDRKAMDMTVLKIEKLTTLADYFIICSGTSNTHLRAISDAVDEELSKVGIEKKSVEGYRSASWILLDYGSVVVHIFKKDTREFYSLERQWADATKIDVKEFIKEE